MEPAGVLGPAHPLTRAMQGSRGVARQAVAVAMTLAAALTASINGFTWAPAFALAAGVVLAALGAVALVEHLATWGGSSLYGHDLAPLRDDLGRVRYLLEQS